MVLTSKKPFCLFVNVMNPKTRQFLATSLALSVLPFGFSADITAEASLNHAGKATAVVSVRSDLAYDAFSERAEAKARDFCMLSGYKDAVTIKSIHPIEDGYDLDMSLRRLDKVKMQGTFLFGEFSSFGTEGSEARKAIENAARGNIETVCGAYVDGSYATMKVSRDTRVKISPKTPGEEEVPLADFLAASAAAKSADTMLFYRAFDTDCVTKITLKIPGKVAYIGGEGIRALSQDKLELTPVSIPVTITKTITFIDENGVEKTTTEVKKKDDAKGFAGYFVYRESLSPVALGFLIAGAALLAGGIAAASVYFVRLGKKEIAKKEAAQ